MLQLMREAEADGGSAAVIGCFYDSGERLGLSHSKVYGFEAPPLELSDH
jgi:hypothetical protein